MARNITQLTVFVSSPSGLDEDRIAVQSSVAEANKILAPANISIETFLWEKDSTPGRGGVSAQDVVNAALDQRTDILITIMHNRVGTATPSSISGTVEEFDRIHNLILSGRNNIEVCVYFCVAPISPLSDAGQLKSMQEFRARVQGLAYLTRDYEKPTDLSIMLISHLVEKAQVLVSGELSGRSNGDESGRELTAFERIVTSDLDDDDDAPGMLDFEAAAIEKIERSGEHLNNISGLIESYANTMSLDAKQIDKMAADMELGLPVDRLKIINNFAENLIEHLDIFEPTIIQFEESFSLGSSATLGMIQEWPADTEESRFAMSSFIAVVQQTLDGLQSLRDAVSSIPLQLQILPGLSKQLKKAKNRGNRVYLRLQDSLDRNAQTLISVIEVGNRKASEQQ